MDVKGDKLEKRWRIEGKGREWRGDWTQERGKKEIKDKKRELD